MPELPEVETIRRQLEREIVGKKLKTVDAKDTKVLRRQANKKQFASRLEGAKLKSLHRKGTWLQFTLDTGDLLLVNLGATGQVRKAAAKDTIDKGTAVTFIPSTGGQLRFVDPKGQMELVVVTPEELREVVPELGELGLDVVDSPVSWTVFARVVLSRDMKLKTLLTEPTILTGIGPVYADEILFEAGLRFDRASNSLSVQEVRRLYRAVVEKLHDAVKHGGSTVADKAFADLHGKAGGFTEYHEVYERDGQACRRCRSVVSKTKFQGRNTYLCEQCQT